MLKRHVIWMLAGALALAGCAGTAPAPAPETEEAPAREEEAAEAPEAAAEEEAEEENYDTGDASLDDPRNADGIGEKELLVVSFGTSYNDSRRLTIGGIEGALEAANPDWSVRRGFTSQIIIDHVLSRDGVAIDNVTQALDRAADNGVKTLVVQPTHLMPGFEYHDLVDEVAQYADAFEAMAVGEPLLTSDEDFSRVAKIIADMTEEYDDGATAIVFMGHGTEADSNAVYARMQEVLAGMGEENMYIGTVEAAPSVDDVLAAIKDKGYTKVVLEPLMIVAGDHANNDMAGDGEDSWKSLFEANGYEVECILRGLGEVPEIQELFAEHARAAIDSLGLPTEEEKRVADASDMAPAVELDLEGLVPVPADALREGTYEVSVDCSSSMFKILKAELTVEEDGMRAALTMGSSSYRWLYPGTAEEAAEAGEEDFISSRETGEGLHVFEIPVEALDAPVPCAAFSNKKELWYDRTLVFRSASLPLEAFREESLVTVESLGLEDGVYRVGVSLSGGSGKAQVESPALLTVADGKGTVSIVWSSSNYDYMVLSGERYDPVNEEGNSVFELPFVCFDRPVAVLADTTAMSTPHEIEYTLVFDAASLEEAAP